jgi:hypothetical protein
MLPTEDLFVYVYVLVDDAIGAQAIAIPPRPGPAPACSDAELLAIALVRHLLGRRSEAGFLAEVARDWGHLFPRLPHQSEANRRIRWLWGAFEQLRAMLAARLPEDDGQQIDTSALPVKHASRVRGPDGWTGPGNALAARFGRDAAHAEWFYGFRLAVRTDLGRRIVRALAMNSSCDFRPGRPAAFHASCSAMAASISASSTCSADARSRRAFSAWYSCIGTTTAVSPPRRMTS